MGRRDQWKQASNKMFGEITKKKSFEEREKVPDVACGLCKNFSENAYASDGRGVCKTLKIGSDISSDKPVYVLTGYPAPVPQLIVIGVYRRVKDAERAQAETGSDGNKLWYNTRIEALELK